MNTALILLLVTFVRSESDGVVLPGEGGHRQFEEAALGGWDGEEFPYAEDVGEEYRKRSLTTDALTRRSALDKNFMRFGRGGEGAQEALGGRARSLGAVAFSRPGRGVKDSFIRFGRGGEGSGFIRFGRTRPEDFFRAGKSLRENFIRFGRGLERECPDGGLEQPLRRTAKSSRAQENFMRFGKSGRNGTNFLRFGKSPPEADDSDAEDSAPQEQLAREKRQTRQQLFSPAPNRPTPFFQPRHPPAPFAPPLDPSWPPSRSIITARLTPFFPPFPTAPRDAPPFLTAPKRNHGSSNFIRFG